MLFRQKEKINDIGKNNFREFLRNENNSQSKTIRLMNINSSSKKSRKLQISYQISQDIQSTISEGNGNAQHMNTFLKQSKYSNMASSEIRDDQSLNLQSIYNTRQHQLNSDHFIDYLNMSKINHVIADHPVNLTQGNILQRIQPPLKNYKQDQLSLSQIAQLKQPSGYLQELKQTINEQKQYKEWKLQYAQANKAYKKIKNAFKSGIFGVDNPTIDGSQLYQEENKLYKLNQEKKAEHFVNRHNSLEKYSGSSLALKEPKRLSQFQPQPCYDMGFRWMNKKRIDLNLNTQDRLFGEKIQRTSSLRAENLRQQELRGRNYDCITMVKV